MFGVILTMVALLLFTEPVTAQSTNLALGKKYRVDFAADASYPDTKNSKLTDGQYALANFLNPGWAGYAGRDHRIIVLDLEDTVTIEKLNMGFVKNEPAGILFPVAMSIASSINGTDWDVISTERFSTKDMPKGITARTTIELDAGNTEARYIAVKFDVGVWVFVDEIEVWGTKGETGTSAPSESYLEKIDFNALQNIFGQFFTEEYYHSMEGDFQRASKETGYAQDIMLIYDQANGIKWKENYALPYVAYLDQDKKPVEWFFDTFLFLALTTPSGRNFGAGSLATKEDWLWWLDREFTEGEGFDAFNKAVKTAGEQIGDLDHKIKVIVMIPYPSETATNPFDKDNPFYLTSSRVGRKKAAENRFNVVKWYIEEFERRFNEANFEHLELIGYYWLSENVDMSSVDRDYLPELGGYIRDKNLRFYWIPYFMASGYSEWQEAGFDAAMLQPNYMFARDKNNSRLLRAAIEAKLYGMGLEFEADPVIMIIESQRERYYDYLRTAATLNYGNDILRGWYQDVKLFHDAAMSDWPEIREIYDKTYEFVKGRFNEQIQFE